MHPCFHVIFPECSELLPESLELALRQHHQASSSWDISQPTEFVPLLWSFPAVSGCAQLYAKLTPVRSQVGGWRRLHSNVESDLFCCRTEWSEDSHSEDCTIDRLWLWLLLASCPFPWVERPSCLVHVPYVCWCSIAKDPRFERLPCTHSGTYADDCLVERVRQVGIFPTMGANINVVTYMLWGLFKWKECHGGRKMHLGVRDQGNRNLWACAFSSWQARLSPLKL